MSRELQSSIVDKCAKVIDLLAKSQNAMSFTEIVTATQFTKSSAHRILTVLLGEKMLGFDDQTKTYNLGPRLVNWARAAWQKTDLQQISDAELIDLREKCGMNVAVSIQNGDAVLFIRTMDSYSVRYAAKIGEESPLHCTAAGKLFLAFGNQGGADPLVQAGELEKYTEFTITSVDALKKELEKVRKTGLAVCDREEFLQVSGIAAPIFDYQSRIIAALSLWAPTKLATVDDLMTKAPLLAATAAGISARFGAMT